MLLNPLKIEKIDEYFQVTFLSDLNIMIPSEYIKMLTNRVMTVNTHELFKLLVNLVWKALFHQKKLENAWI